MPARVFSAADRVEFGLVLLGAVLLWRLALSPSARVRRQPAALVAWTAPVSDFLLYLWVTVCGALVVPFLVSLLLHPSRHGENAQLVIATGSLELGLLAGIAAYRFGFAHEPSPLPASAPATALRSGVTTFLVAMPVVVAVALAWQYLLKLCGLPVEEQDIIGRLLHARSHALLVAMIGLATVTAPLAEELVFRAGFFRYLRTRLPRWAALLAPACLFAALHQNLASFAPLVALGIVFSLAYERTGRISTSIVAHGLFNAHTIAIVLLGGTP